uniref:Uncharacterized protein n=1 Tax=Knipowitschia caucasica TaxID=637954 RepID=A0AAV2KYT4_KNICA
MELRSPGEVKQAGATPAEGLMVSGEAKGSPMLQLDISAFGDGRLRGGGIPPQLFLLSPDFGLSRLPLMTTQAPRGQQLLPSPAPPKALKGTWQLGQGLAELLPIAGTGQTGVRCQRGA